MRTLVLVVAFGIAALSLASFAPTANAVGWCTSAGPAGHQCRDHIVCFGWSWGPGYERCQYGIREPYCTCPPMDVLP